MDKIKFAIPGLWDHFLLTKELVKYMELFPDHCYPNIEIGAVYGNFPYTIWDGGRIFCSELKQASLEDITEIKTYLQEKNIPLRLIFTNPVLEPVHYLDRFCNLVCTTCEDEKNEIVVNNSGLEEYLRNKYPKFGYISSTTKCNGLDNSLKELNNYKYICLDYNQNHSKKLNTLSPEEKNKIEFLCNAICPPGCPNRKEHYRLNGITWLNFYKPYYIDCSIQESLVAKETREYKNNISPQEIYNVFAPQGFSMFKLEGRTIPTIDVILTYAYYFIKPEHKDFFVSYVLERVPLNNCI